MSLNKFIFGVVVTLLMAIFTFSARAATFTVTNTNNAGPGSIRAAVDAANSTPESDSIDFNIPADDPNCVNSVCSIQLLEQLTVSGNLTITNSTGANGLRLLGIVSLNGPARVMGVGGGANVTIDGVTLANGSVTLSDSGGCISNAGTLTLRNSVVSGCQTLAGGGGGGNGGGISNTGALTLLRTTVANNSQSGSLGGGGIFNGRSRNARCRAPPPQIRTCGVTASGSCLRS